MKNTSNTATKCQLPKTEAATAADFIFGALDGDLPAGKSLDELTPQDMQNAPHWWPLVVALRAFRDAGAWQEPAQTA